MSVDVAAIRAALAKATPGPWATDGWTVAGDQSWIPDRGDADAELIVLLRNNIEVLLDEVERRRARPVDLSGWVGQSVEWDTTDYLANVNDDGSVRCGAPARRSKDGRCANHVEWLGQRCHRHRQTV